MSTATLDSLPSNPYDLFLEWYDEALGDERVPNPEAVALATATPSGAPSNRMVALKGFDHRGAVFSTNYQSRKGRELRSNPQAALLFWWQPLGRQVRIEGRVSSAESDLSDRIFDERPLASRWAACLSAQSESLSDRDRLLAEHAKVMASGQRPQRPEHWGAFRLDPLRFEFWSDAAFRLHERWLYQLNQGDWEKVMLAP